MIRPLEHILIPVGLIAVGGLLGWSFFLAVTGEAGERLAAVALAHVPDSGVSNPVTSVLLNFRAYDTLLELAVLLAALLGIWSLGTAGSGFQPAASVLDGMVAGFVPLLILSAGYMLWVGAYAPGGAFQAGALLGAAGVMLALAGHRNAGLPSEGRLRLLVALGVFVFAMTGLLLMVVGDGFLTYPRGLAKWLILIIETAATLSIGATLAAAYLGGRPAAHPKSGEAT
ncbi:MnhB domain-containing protein [Thiocapsa sp.]|uniref:MnhB domain-containing protein n=1 Tax=Thiocapsa sp. TaxID=2024551 RepID=UPI0025F4D3D9|nr:MnhB domain-containing protein [Thiocapsa sp.]